MYVCQMTTFESLDIQEDFRTSDISPGVRVKFVYEGHRVDVKVTGAKKGHKYLFIDQLRSAIFIGTRQMVPQSTRRGWSGLRSGHACYTSLSLNVT